MIRSLGGRFVLSDDSHGPHAVGLNYNRLFTFLREDVKLKELYYLQRTDGVGGGKSRGGRNVQVVRVPDPWWEDPFWKAMI